MMGEVKGYINEMAIDIASFPVTPKNLAALINMVDNNEMGRTMASQQLFPILMKGANQVCTRIGCRSWIGSGG